MRILVLAFLILCTSPLFAQNKGGITFQNQVYYSNGFDHNGICKEAFSLYHVADSFSITHYVAADSILLAKDNPSTDNGELIPNMKRLATYNAVLVNDSTIWWEIFEWHKDNIPRTMVYTCTLSKDWQGQAEDVQYVLDCRVYDKGLPSNRLYSIEKPFKKILRTHSIYIGH